MTVSAFFRTSKINLKKLLFRLGICSILILCTASYWARLQPPQAILDMLDQDEHHGQWLYDRKGVLLRATRSSIESDHKARGLSIPLSQVSPWVGESLICLEDQTFRQHWGVPWRGVIRALWVNLRHRRLSVGGSGLTQQLIKLHHRRARGVIDKIQEARWAWWIDAQFEKDEILERYLNNAPFGHGIKGIWGASRYYFNQSPHQLSIAQAAYLASLPHAPTSLDPLRDPHSPTPRQRVALQCLSRRGLITKDELQRVLEEPIYIRASQLPFEAPHLIDSLIEGNLSESLFSFPSTLKRNVDREHHEVHLSLDLSLQRSAEDLIDQFVRKPASIGVRQVAAVALEVSTGEVIFWIGSKRYHHPDAGQVDHVLGMRQPGSTLKPFLYGLALDRGFDLTQQLTDQPVYFRTPSGHYQPTNYNHQTRGSVSLMSSLAMSLNIPTVSLLNQIGVGELLTTLRAAGLDTLSQSAEHYGLGLSLGDGDVRLIDLVNAYRGLMNGGVYTPWRVMHNTRSAPNTPAIKSRRFLSNSASQTIVQVLSSDHLRTPTFGRHGPLSRPYPTMVKTGTSQGYTNAWAVGGTPRYMVGVWIMPRAGVELSGGLIAAPLWAQLIDLLQQEQPGHTLPWRAISPHHRRILAPLIKQDQSHYQRSKAPPWIAESLAELEMDDLTGESHETISSPTIHVLRTPRIKIVAPPDQSTYRHFPEVSSQRAQLKTEARLRDQADLDLLITGEFVVEWMLNHQRVSRDQVKTLNAWINPWVEGRSQHQLCVQLLRVDVAIIAPQSADHHHRQGELIDRDCVSFFTPPQ